MKYNELEKHFQQKLSEHEVAMNTDLLVADLFGNKKRKNPLFLWLAGIMAVLMAAFTFYMWKAKTQEKLDSRHKTEIQKVKAVFSHNAMETKTPVVLASVNSSDNVIKSTNINSNSQNIREENISEINTTSIQNNKLNSGIAKKKVTGKSSVTLNNGFSKRGIVVDKNEKYSQKKYGPAVTNESKPAQQSNSTNSIKLNLKELEAANTLVISDFTLDNNNQVLPGVKCPTFKQKKQWVFSIIPEAGYFYPLTTFQSNSDAEVLDLRKNNETTLEGLQAAIYGKISHKRRPWYLKSGLNYGRITRKMDLNQSYTQSDTTIGIISITESQNGDTITVIRGPIVTETHITRREVAHYYHHLWSIPLTVGYQQHNDYFEWGVEAGVNFNLSSKQTGYVMTTADDFGAVSAAGLYKRKLGLSYLAQAHIGLPFSEKSILSMAIRANINPNNYATNASFIDEKYQMLGVHLFYEYKF